MAYELLRKHPFSLFFSLSAKQKSVLAEESSRLGCIFRLNLSMSTAAQAFSGNLKKALAGLRRIELDGLRWRVFDAKGQVLGRLASQIATVVQGKDKPTYAPNRDDGDMCVIINAKDVCVTGRKMTDKFYRWHTGYIGHLKERSLKDQMAKDPTEVIRKAIMRMLPRNKLRDDRDRKLRIFAGSEHPFGDRAIEPYVMPPRQVREMRPRARRAMIRAQKKAEEQAQGTTNPKKGKKRDKPEAEISA
ncbi:50S ribosomal protein L13-like [Salvia splendens]|uniref:50S ribosomal protein L13-like n=1 Tax=Salvia splendens TaxID=180675 RepID=UPI001C27E847|nr:50S ribosomal protein L13-like [Salvia splendens]